MRVLIADDDEDQLLVRKMLLDQLGFTTLTGSDQKSALKAAKSDPPACAVLDFLLPDAESGLGLIRELKRLYPEIRIVVLTGKGPQHLNRLPERALIDEVIDKGTPASYLVDRLRRFDADRKHAAELAAKGSAGR
jgi:two-component system, OmpR family, response regulator